MNADSDDLDHRGSSGAVCPSAHHGPVSTQPWPERVELLGRLCEAAIARCIRDRLQGVTQQTLPGVLEWLWQARL